MTFEDEVSKETVDMCDEFGIGEATARVIAWRRVEERREWRRLTDGLTAVLDEHKLPWTHLNGVLANLSSIGALNGK